MRCRSGSALHDPATGTIPSQISVPCNLLPQQMKNTFGPMLVELGPDGKPCLPKHFFPHFAKLTHGLDHVSKGGMLNALTAQWFTKGFSSYAQKYCQSCMVCVTHNAGKAIHTSQSAHPPPERPFEHLMMDFVEICTSSSGHV